MRVTRGVDILAVRLPKAVAEQVRLRAAVEVDIAVSDGCVTNQRRPRSDGLHDLTEITPDDRHGEAGGAPQGDEAR
jgi:antitoxin component of MazEF toxin-antitoxin module